MPSKKQNKNKNKVNTGAVVNVRPVGNSTTIKRPTPKVVFGPDGTCRIGHTEYIADVAGSAFGNNYIFKINPQDSTTFTWLSSLATRFEMYHFIKLQFMFRTSASTTREGSVLLGVDFDAYDPFPSKTSMLSWKNSAKGPIWKDTMLNATVDAARMPWKYSDSSSPSTRGDIRLDDLGNFVVIVTSGGDSSPIGELYVSYLVEFKQPSLRIPPALYGTMPDHILTGSIPTTNAFLTPGAYAAGNVDAFATSPSVLEIKTVGKFLLTLWNQVVAGATEITGQSTTILAQEVAGFPGGRAVITPLHAARQVDRAFQSQILEVLNAPIELIMPTLSTTLSGPSAELLSSLILSTYNSPAVS